MKLEDFAKYKKKLPDSPGVYIFYWRRRARETEKRSFSVSEPKSQKGTRGLAPAYLYGPRGKVLYVGKATSVRDRVRSYFNDDLIATRGPLLVDMVTKATGVKGIPTDSVLEALLLEAQLIRRHQPVHNTELKDDKSFNYLVITREAFPRVLIVRGKDLRRLSAASYQLSETAVPGLKAGTWKLKAVFGPFPHGGQFKEALKLIRKIFPYRDDCLPAQILPDGKIPAGKPCFNAQIGRCPGVCAGWITPDEYRKVIRHIILLFQGKKKKLLRELEREMRQYAKAEEFEKAAKVRASLFGLRHIQDVSLIKDEFRNGGMSRTIRIEAYDIAHISGTSSVGVMTVVEDGEVKRGEYRKFRIRAESRGSDTAALTEVIARRLGHNEWQYPRLIVVDGSTAQMNAAKTVLQKYGVEIPIVGVVKDERHRARRIAGAREHIAGREADILLANAEAHRFAITYHRKLRSSIT